MQPHRYAGLDLLATLVALVRSDGQVMHVNAAFENCYGLSAPLISSLNLSHMLQEQTLLEILSSVDADEVSASRFEDMLRRPSGQADLPVQVVISKAEGESGVLVAELLPIEQQVRLEREARLLEQTQANKELIRNLAHEIKNPLGGIRGAAQLLQMEVRSADLAEYAEVIIREADRLQVLVDRLLEPHRQAQMLTMVNIHEVCERVCALIAAEFPQGLEIVRDYDASIPELLADPSQLIQAVLNIAHNAAQALAEQIELGSAILEIRTRVARQVTFGKQRHRLALELHIIDNGPGIPVTLRDRIFYPMVSGREGGSGLGLTLAQTFVQQHQGMIECSSQPGHTDFMILIPLPL